MCHPRQLYEIDLSKVPDHVINDVLDCLIQEAHIKHDYESVDCRARLPEMRLAIDDGSRAYQKACLGKYVIGRILHRGMVFIPQDVFTNPLRIYSLILEWHRWILSYLQFIGDKQWNRNKPIPDMYRQWADQYGLDSKHYDEPLPEVLHFFDYIKMNGLPYLTNFSFCLDEECFYVFFDEIAKISTLSITNITKLLIGDVLEMLTELQ